MHDRRYLLLCIAAVCISASCGLPRLDLIIPELGSLKLELDTMQAKTITPSISMTPAYFELSGEGPEGATFSVSTADDSITLDKLIFGPWIITAEAYNAADLLISEGSAEVEIHTNEVSTLVLNMSPVSGAGTLSVEVTWNENLLFNPSVTGALTGGEGINRTADFQLTGNGTATANLSDISAGYYTLTTSLRDGDAVVAGLTEVVRILAGKTTAGSFSLDRINKPGQAIEIQSDSFTLAWDPPADSAVTGYRIYYRPKGTYVWQLLDELASETTPELTVTSSMLPYDTYEFAVSSLDGTYESDLHESMGDDAFPATGWYIVWSSGV